MKVGDLVQYSMETYPVKKAVRHRWEIYKGDIGIVMNVYWEDPNRTFSSSQVAEVLFFSTGYLKKSYLRYLKLISEAEDER